MPVVQAVASENAAEPGEVSLEDAGFEPAPTAAPAAQAPLHHIINPEELFDIQQQAEFFVSVGEHDQAVEVLRQHCLPSMRKPRRWRTWICCACTVP